MHASRQVGRKSNMLYLKVFALPPAVAETVGARLVLTDDDVIKNLRKRTCNNSNVARRCHNVRQILLAETRFLIDWCLVERSQLVITKPNARATDSDAVKNARVSQPLFI